MIANDNFSLLLQVQEFVSHKQAFTNNKIYLRLYKPNAVLKLMIIL